MSSDGLCVLLSLLQKDWKFLLDLGLQKKKLEKLILKFDLYANSFVNRKIDAMLIARTDDSHM